MPTMGPSSSPSDLPTKFPSAAPSPTPSMQPSIAPSTSPSASPSSFPTNAPSPAGYKAPVIVRYYHDSCIASPTPEPLPPSFVGGSLITAGSGGDHSTLSAAIAAATAGDRIQVLAGTITEAAVVTVGKSLEIFGTGPECIVRRDSTTAVLSISAGVNNVYIHNLGILNNQLASGDGGGQSSCITAGTMQDAYPDGSTGIYIASCTFTYPRIGVSLDASGWVVKNCIFNPNSPTPGATIRALSGYGSTGNSFAVGNIFNNPTEATRLTAVALNAAGPRGASFVTGYKGNLTLADNVISSAGGNPRSYIDTTGMFRQPGAQDTLGNNGEFSMYLKRNNFSINYTSAPCLFYVAAGAYSGGSTIQAFSFFDNLLVQGNVFGARTASAEKGALFFTSNSAKPLGSFGGGFYAGENTFATPNVDISALYSDASTISNLLVVENSIYTAPSPLITPIFPGTTTGLPVVDGVKLVTGDRVFAEDTCDAISNGIYITDTGSWPRADDFTEGMNVAGTFFSVLNGTQFGGTTWNCTNTAPNDVVGTNPLFFGQQA